MVKHIQTIRRQFAGELFKCLIAGELFKCLTILWNWRLKG